MPSKNGLNALTQNWNVTSLVNEVDYLIHTQNTSSNSPQSSLGKVLIKGISGVLDRMASKDARKKSRNGAFQRQQNQPPKLPGQPVATPEAYGLSYWNV